MFLKLGFVYLKGSARFQNSKHFFQLNNTFRPVRCLSSDNLESKKIAPTSFPKPSTAISPSDQKSIKQEIEKNIENEPPPAPHELPKHHGKYSPHVVKQNVQGYVFTRYIDYVKNYDKLLEKKFPQAVKAYNIFFDGVKFFLADLKRYLKIWKIVNISTEGFEALNRSEIELYMQMPRDMFKISPALLTTALPFVGYLAFPIAYAKPRIFLTSHFWTIQQKNEFQLLNLKERLVYNKPIFRYLQSKLKTNKKHELYDQWRNILGLIGSGRHPTSDEIIAVKELFTNEPYSFVSLPSSHIKNLCHNHGVPGIIFKRNKLLEHGYLLHNMDRAIKREGDVHNMTTNALRYSCILRGLNPSNLSNDEMIEWLREWVKVSLALDEDHIGLFVHLPVLMTYNNPNNWKLIY